MELSKELISVFGSLLELSAQFISEAAHEINCSRNVMTLYLLIVYRHPPLNRYYVITHNMATLQIIGCTGNFSIVLERQWQRGIVH